MGNGLVFLIFLNCMLVSVLLWLITYVGSYLYKPTQDLNREVHFECGFFTMNKLIPSYNLNFVISAIFLVLYDIELLLLIPILFNFYFSSVNMLGALFLLLFFVLFSLLIDIESNTIKWYFS